MRIERRNASGLKVVLPELAALRVTIRYRGLQ